jgi:hypothetical protein
VGNLYRFSSENDRFIKRPKILKIFAMCVIE